MRTAVALLVLGLASPCLAAAPASSTRSLPTHPLVLRLQGHEFSNLAAWAQSNQLRLSWDRDSRDLQLTNRTVRLAFTLNSRQAEINGVRVWLSFPVTLRDQALFIATTDLRTLLTPVLRPPRDPPGRHVRVIALDPGHGGKDAGFEVGSRQEKTHALLLARKLRSLLQEAGLKVVLTRSSDEYVDHEQRTLTARLNRADLFVSLHYNAFSNPDVKGVEVYCVTPAGASSTNDGPNDASSTAEVPGNRQNTRSALLAYQIQRALVRSLPVEDRGVRHARFLVLTTSTMPAVLIEGGFMSAKDEARQIFTLAYRNQVANAILDGILAYKRLVERE